MAQDQSCCIISTSCTFVNQKSGRAPMLCTKTTAFWLVINQNSVVLDCARAERVCTVDLYINMLLHNVKLFPNLES